MLATIKNLLIKLTRDIILSIHPESFANLLDASPGTRRLFAVHDNDLPFAHKHISSHCDWAKPDVPLWRLPDAYVLCWLLEMWEEQECCGPNHFHNTAGHLCIGRMFSNLKCSFRILESAQAPHHPHTWMERVMLKVLRVASLEKRRKCIMALKLASLLDSVPILKLVLTKLFSGKMKQKAPRSVNLIMAFNIYLGAKCTFAWSLAYEATWAATDGAVHVLNYVLQHPLHPVAYTLRWGSKTGCLIHKAARGGQTHVIHQLLGNPLPLAPPPKGRPIRPGNLSGPNPPFDPWCQPAFKNILYGDRNPLATLFDVDGGIGKYQPLFLLVSTESSDRHQAVAYLLDQGAEPKKVALAVT
ncbi:hypothetical protein HDU96_003290 [Phlyctochytrium bullatum]|nr:hypothetical protein HDU96_003290 [Phlyctochytrium bullatum]